VLSNAICGVRPGPDALSDDSRLTIPTLPGPKDPEVFGLAESLHRLRDVAMALCSTDR